MLTDTQITFDQNQCTVDDTTITKTHFDIDCSVGSAGASLLASFDFVADNADANGNDGLEYSLTLTDYSLSSNTSKLIFMQKMADCSDIYSYFADSDDAETDTSEDDDDDLAETTETPDRRRMSGHDHSHDDESEEDASKEEASDDGVSSDESDEIDVGIAQFLKTGEAHDICYNDINNPTDVQSNDIILSNVVWIEDDEQIHIVVDNFDCVLQIDPWIGYAKEKLLGNSTSDGSVANIIGTIVAMILLILFL